MTEKHKHHHHEKSSHKHEHHVEIEDKKRRMRVGSKSYEWEVRQWRKLDYTYDDDWFRIRSNGKRKQVTEIRRIEKLEHLRTGARRRDLKQLQKDVLLVERASLGLSYSDEESASDEEKLTPWQKHNQPQASGEIKRDKYGIKIYSLPEKKFYLQVTVNNSTKYPGSASVRFFIGGKPWMYTFDVEAMEALRREFARAGLPKGS